MDLIKKIKDAERQAQQIIEQAGADAARQGREGQAIRLKALAQAEQERKKTIEAAVETAHSQALAEIQQLKEQAEKHHQQLRENTNSKIAAATKKVMDYLKG